MGTGAPETPGCYTEHGVSGYGVAAKLSSEKPMDEASVKKMAEEMMLGIARKCMERGAKYIGHIKSHLGTSAGTVKADTIGVAHGAYSTGKLARSVSEINMAVNSIVQGIPEGAVKEATLEGIHEVAVQYGVSVIKEKEHTYFDEFDFLTSDQEHQKQLEAQFAAAEKTDSQ